MPGAKTNCDSLKPLRELQLCCSDHFNCRKLKCSFQCLPGVLGRFLVKCANCVSLSLRLGLLLRRRCSLSTLASVNVSVLESRRPVSRCPSSSWRRASSPSSSWRGLSSTAGNCGGLRWRGSPSYQRSGTTRMDTEEVPRRRAAATTSTWTSRLTPPSAPSCSSCRSRCTRCSRASPLACRARNQRYERTPCCPVLNWKWYFYPRVQLHRASAGRTTVSETSGGSSGGFVC